MTNLIWICLKMIKMNLEKNSDFLLIKVAANTVHDLSVEKIKKVEKRTPEKNKKRQNLVEKINIEGRKERPVQKIDYFSILKNSDGM